MNTTLRHKPGSLKLDEFLGIYGRIYEHSPWIAEAAYASGSAIDTVEGLYAAMVDAVAQGGRDRQLALIRAHPVLGVAPAQLDTLTKESVSEQKGAGLNQCTPEEFAEFQKLNAAYGEKFGFPFIIAVKGLGRQDILKAFRARIQNDPETEFAAALEQINKIAKFRLMELAV